MSKSTESKKYRIYCTHKEDTRLRAIEFTASSVDQAMGMALNAGWIMQGVPEEIDPDPLTKGAIGYAAFIGVLMAMIAYGILCWIIGIIIGAIA